MVYRNLLYSLGKLYFMRKLLVIVSITEVWSGLFVTPCNWILENKQKSPLHRVKPPCHLIDATAREGGYGGVRGAVGEWLICLINEPRSNVCSHTWLKCIFAPSVDVIINDNANYNSQLETAKLVIVLEQNCSGYYSGDVKSAYMSFIKYL